MTGFDFKPYDPATVAAEVQYGTATGQLDRTATGNASLVYTNVYEDSSWSTGHTYSSPILHHVLLSGLQPSTLYFYRVGAWAAGGLLFFPAVLQLGPWAHKPPGGGQHLWWSQRWLHWKAFLVVAVVQSTIKVPAA